MHGATQSRRHSLSHQAVVAGDMRLHPLLVDDEAIERGAAVRGRAAGDRQELADRRPLSMPAAGGTLVLLDERGQQGRNQPGRSPGGGDGEDRVGGIALLRHRRRATAELFTDLRHLGLGEKDEVASSAQPAEQLGVHVAG
jgi:hypothetical protein